MSEEPSYNISDYALPEYMTSGYTTPDKYASFVLCPSGQTLDDLSKNLVLIDKRVKDYETIISCLMPNTEYIMFDIDLDDLTALKNKIVGNYQHIGLLQHNTSYNEHVNSYSVVVDGETIPVLPVAQTTETPTYNTDASINSDIINIDISPSQNIEENVNTTNEISTTNTDTTNTANTDNMFVDSSGILYDISLVQFNTSVHKKWKMLNRMKLCQIDCSGDYSSWSDFLDFLDFLKDKTQHFDLMACNLWSDNDWKDVITFMSDNYVNVRASSNNTGHTGDFILESENISMIGVYFTPGILDYKYDLADNFPYSGQSLIPTFSAFSTISTQNTRNLGLSLTAIGSTRVAVFSTFIGIFYTRIINDSWGTFTSATSSFDVTPLGDQSAISSCITSDARRLIVPWGTFGTLASSPSALNNYIYWCDASGLLNGTSSSLSFKRILDTTLGRFYNSIATTDDGSRFVVNGITNSTSTTFVYFASWNGTNYSTLTRILDTRSNTVAVCLSRNGDILAFTSGTTVCWSYWNGTNYSVGTAISGSVNNVRCLQFVGNNTNILVNIPAQNTSQYSVWNGNTYGAWTAIPTTSIPSAEHWEAEIDNSNNLYLSPNGNTNVYKTSISLSSIANIPAVSFPNYTVPLTLSNNQTTAMAITTPGSVRVAVYIGLNGIFYSRIINGNWGAQTATSLSFNLTPPANQGIACCMIPDASRLVIAYGHWTTQSATNPNHIYWGSATNLLNGTSSALSFTRISDSATRVYRSLAMTSDGSRIVAGSTLGGIYFSSWNGTNYGTLTQILDTTSNVFNSFVTLSSDGNWLAFNNSTSSQMFWSVWNGSNYSVGTQISGTSIFGQYARHIHYVNGNPNMIVQTNNAVGGYDGRAQYSVWNGTYYSPLATIATSVFPTGDNWGVTTDSDYNIYMSSYGSSSTIKTLIKTTPVFTYSFTNYKSAYSSQSLRNVSFAMSAIGNNRIAVFAGLGGLYYVSISGDTWSTNTSISSSFDVAPNASQYACASISTDATKLIISAGTWQSTDNWLYWGDASGLLSGSSSSVSFTRIADTTQRIYNSTAMTPDGLKIVASTSQYVYFSTWNGTNYGALTQILDYTAGNCIGLAVSDDGTRIIYGKDSTYYWSVWNGTNYGVGAAIPGTTSGTKCRSVKFIGGSTNVAVVLSQNGNPQFSVWNGSFYNPLLNVPRTSLPAGDYWGLVIDNSGIIYASPYGNPNIYTSTISLVQPIYGVTFGTSSVALSSRPFSALGLALTDTSSVQLAIHTAGAGTSPGLYYSRIINSYWINTTSVTCSFDVNPTGSEFIACAISADASRLVISAGIYATSNHYLYWCDARALLNGTSSSLSFTAVDTTPSHSYYYAALTGDGNRLLVNSINSGTGVIYMYTWNGTTYSNRTTVTTFVSGGAMSISYDGYRIAYIENRTIKWGTWNGSTYTNITAISGIVNMSSIGTRAVAFVGANTGNNTDMIVSTPGTAQAQYSIWNGSSYEALVNIPISSIPQGNGWGLAVDRKGVIYSSFNDINTIYACPVSFNFSSLVASNSPVLYTANMFSGYSTTISGQADTYKNGTYSVCASSFAYQDINNQGPPWMAFNLKTTNTIFYDYWHSSTGYSLSNGAYTGVFSTTNIVGSPDISGEWIQIQLPYKLLVKSVGLLSRQSSTVYINRLPVSMVILGSNDGSNWNILYSQTTRPYTYSATSVNTINIEGVTTPYSYLRLIGRTTPGGSLSDALNIEQLNYAGDIYAVRNPEKPTLNSALSTPTNLYVNPATQVIYKSNLFNSNTATITGETLSYRNGTYIASSSSSAPNSGDTNYLPYNSLNLTSTYWDSGNSTYSSGSYVGSVSTSNIVGSSAINGEWIQIKLPYLLLLKNISFLSRQDGSYIVRLPVSMVILGSNDGNIWNILYSQTSRPYTFASYTNVINISGVTTAYSYLRLIIRSIESDATSTSVIIQQLNYGGDIYSNSYSSSVSTMADVLADNYAPVSYATNLFNSTNSLTLSNTNPKYRNGTYTISASSTSSDDNTNYGPWLAFNLGIGTSSSGVYWMSNSTAYNSSTGEYAGAIATTNIINSSDISGEWIQIQLPYKLLMKSIGLLGGQTSGSATAKLNNLPVSMVLLGSNDGTYWNILYSQTSRAFTYSSNSVNTISITGGTTSYSYFRLIGRTIGTGATSLQIQQLNYFGDVYSSDIIQSSLANSYILADNNVPVNYTTNLFSSNNTTLNRKTPSYYNGNYVFSASSTLYSASYTSNGGYFSPFIAFNMGTASANDSIFWHSAVTYSNGSYTGSVSTSGILNSSPITGEWIQVQLPYRLILRTMDMLSWVYGGSERLPNLPVALTILGSNDGTTWTIAYRQYAVPYAYTTSNNTIIVNGGIGAFSYFRLIANSVGAGGNGYAVMIQQLNYYGDVYVPYPSPLLATNYAGVLYDTSATVLYTAGLFTSESITNSEQTPLYVNGNYTVSASSVLGLGASGSNYLVRYAFNLISSNSDTNTYWSGNDAYSNTDGSYLGSTTTTNIINSGNLTGEWIQIRLPYKILLKGLYLMSRQSSSSYLTNLPVTMDILGSDDGIVWNYLYTQSTRPYTYSATSSNLISVVGVSIAYSYIRVVARTVGVGGSAFQIQQINYSGDIYPSNNVAKQYALDYTSYSLDEGQDILYNNYSINGGSEFIMTNSVSPSYNTLLSNGTSSYSLKTRNLNSTGFSSYSSAVTETQAITIPNAPIINYLTAGNQQIIVDFTPPSNAGSVSVTDYTYSLNGGADISANTTTSPITITGLTNGTTYSVSIKAVNNLGSSSASNELSATPITVPSAPTINSLTAGNLQISVAFTPSDSSGGSVITTYQYSLNGGAVVNANTTTSPFVITGLTAGTNYSVILVATNAAGNSSNSNSLSATPYTTPSKPIISVSASSSSIVINSITSNANYSDITDYKYSLNGGSYVSIGINTLPYTITGLTPGDGFYVTVKATNVAGDSSASDATYVVVASLPDPPTIDSVLSTTTQGMNVYFTMPANDGYSAITDVLYSIDDASFASAGTTTSPILFTGLTNGQTYSIALKVVNVIGTSSSSNTVSETIAILPDAPTLDSITPGNQQLSISFTAPTTNSYTAITNYYYSLNGGADISANTTTSPFTITGLTNGASYTVRLKTVNRLGASTSSNSITTTPFTIPNKPTITSMATQVKSIIVYFTVPTGGSAITNIQYSLNGQNYVATDASQSPLIIQPITEGITYSVQVKAVNLAGSSTPSDASSIYLPYSYNYNQPISVDTNGEVFVMTLRNELNGDIQYKYSYDGMNWNSQSLPTNVLTSYNPYNVKWVGNQFVMSGDIQMSGGGGSSVLMKSMDGIDFTVSKSASTNTAVYDIESNLEYNNTITFPRDTTLLLGGASADTTKISISYDGGNTWTSSTNSASIFTKTCNGAVWSGKKWVAVGEGNTPVYDASNQIWTSTTQDGNTIATSDDGNLWIGQGKWIFSKSGYDVDWSSDLNMFVAVGDGSLNSMAYSFDGIYWYGLGKSYLEVGKTVSWNGEIWVAGGIKSSAQTSSIVYSYDGIHWFTPSTPASLFPNGITQIVWNDLQWEAYGSDPSYNKAISLDGIVWNTINDMNAQPPNTLYNNSQYLQISSNQVSTSPDNSNWSAPTPITNMSVLNQFAWNRSNQGVPYIQPISIALGEGDNTIAYSYDGIYWNGLGKSIFTDRGNKAVWNGKIWVAVGAGLNWCAVSYDGYYWEAITDTRFTEAYDVAWNGAVFVAVGEGNTTIAISIDGVVWSSISNSTSLFTTKSTAVLWTGKVWLAYGSGSNTTAYSSDPLARIWQATPTPNLCITDVSSGIQLGYGSNISTDPSSTLFYAGWNMSGYEPYRMFDQSANTHYKTNAAFSSANGSALNGKIFQYNNVDGSGVGHPIIMNTSQSITLKGYTLSLPQLSDPSKNVLREWVLLGISGNDTVSNIINTQTPYVADLLHRGYLETLPQSDSNYTATISLTSNTTAYSIYVLLLLSSFSTDVKIAHLDLHYESPHTGVLSRNVRPVITPLGILHPNPRNGLVDTPYILTDHSLNIINDSRVSYTLTVVNEYGTNVSHYSQNINPVFKGLTSQTQITGNSFDGKNNVVSSSDGQIIYLDNTQSNSQYQFDNSFNGSVIQSGLNVIYSNVFNNNFVLLGGSGGSVITYGLLETDVSPTWYTTNANGLFSTVYGLASNSKYGFVYCPNAIYLNRGDKLSVVSPYTYNQNNLMDKSITINLLSSS